MFQYFLFWSKVGLLLNLLCFPSQKHTLQMFNIKKCYECCILLVSSLSVQTSGFVFTKYAPNMCCGPICIYESYFESQPLIWKKFLQETIFFHLRYGSNDFFWTGVKIRPMVSTMLNPFLKHVTLILNSMRGSLRQLRVPFV